MTTLQEAAQAAMKYIRSTADYKAGHPVAIEAAEDLSDALAQQGEQQPVAWYEYNQDLDAWFLAYGHNPKAKTRPLVFGDTAAPACQVDRLQMLVEQVKKAHELAKIMKDFADKNPESLMLKELDN